MWAIQGHHGARVYEKPNSFLSFTITKLARYIACIYTAEPLNMNNREAYQIDAMSVANIDQMI